MFIAERFSYDPIWVQSLQSELYWSLISIPFEISKDLYERSEWILGVFTTLGKDCKTVQTIDHRVFESLHDAIAAKFRFENRNDFELNYPEIPKHRLDTDNIKLRWINYFRSQIETLFEKNTDLPRQIMVAVAYPYPDSQGVVAECYIESVSKDIFLSVRESESAEI